MFLRNLYTSPDVKAQIELRLTREETDCVQVAVQLPYDDLRDMPLPYCGEQDIRRGIQIIGGVIDRLNKALPNQEGGQ